MNIKSLLTFKSKKTKEKRMPKKDNASVLRHGVEFDWIALLIFGALIFCLCMFNGYLQWRQVFNDDVVTEVTDFTAPDRKVEASDFDEIAERFDDRQTVYRRLVGDVPVAPAETPATTDTAPVAGSGTLPASQLPSLQ